MIKSLSKLSFIVIVGLLLVLGVSGTSFAGIIWSQAVDTSVNGYDVDSYFDLSTPYVQLAADDWQCTDGTKDITGINWWGSYNGYGGKDSQFSTSISNFTINIYSDGGTQPGSTYETMGTYTISHIEETYLNLNKGTNESVFKYRVNFDNAFDQSENVTYWLSIYATLKSGYTNSWAWCAADPSYGHGNPAVVTNDFYKWNSQCYPTGHGYVGDDVNLAFDLIHDDGEEIPEPATLILLGSLATGLFGFAGVKKKFKR